MHTETIDTLFKQVISRKGIHKATGKSLSSILQLRYRYRHKGNVSLETKLFFLQKAGVQMNQYQWTDKDMIALIRFYNNTSELARSFGPEYVLEKWKNC